MHNAAVAENKLKKICDDLGITPEGRNWLDVALDPFKDIAQRPTGYPDRIMNNSVVQTVHDSIDVSGSSLGFATNWDCNIFLDQVWKSTALYATGRNFETVQKTGQGVTPYNRGGLVIRAATSGTDLDITTTQNSHCLSLVQDVFDGETSCRLIAIGMEIHNTTPELNKQGALISYRVDDEYAFRNMSMINDTTLAQLSSSCRAVNLAEPPATAGQAIDLPNSVQWEAAKGVYLVPRLSEEDNPAVDLQSAPLMVKDAATGLEYFPQIAMFNLLAGTDSTNVALPFSLSGAFLTGLSPETTLTVNLTYYVEQFPSFGSALKRVSGPSAPEDPAALAFYSKLVRHLPTGVEVNDNFNAAFIRGIASLARTIARAAPTVVKVARGVATGADMVQSLVKGFNDANTGGIPRLPPNSGSGSGREIVEVKEERISRNGNKKTVTETAIVPYQRPATRSAPNKQRRRGPRGQSVKNRRDPSYSRILKYNSDARSGNKWVG